MAKKRQPRTALEGVGWTMVEVNGELMLRCHRCERHVPVMKWWHHGLEADPCRPEKEER